MEVVSMTEKQKRGRPRNEHIYAAYRGERYLMDGTLTEIAAALGMKRRSVRWFLSPAAKKREEAIAKRGTLRSRLSLVLLE